MGSLVWGSWAASLLRHLWQSTVFSAGVWLLTLALRRNAARLRYRLWMTASLKFLLPFSLLIAAGARLSSPGHFDRAQPKIVTVVEGVAQPLLEAAWPADATTPGSVAGTGTGGTTAHASTDWLLLLLLSTWAAGTLLLLARWMRSWQRLRAAVRRGEPVTLADGTPALIIAESVEPGIFGIMRPVLVLPRGIAEQLSAEQLDAIMAHELSHMRRRDNLTAALHMLVEAVFWFHPLVWWLGARLVEERERACDEAVLESRRQPVAYAEGILNVCKFYVEVPLSCVSGVMGSELKRRIARILSGQAARKLDLQRKALLGLAGVLALGAPLALGIVRGTTGALQAAAQAPPKYNITGTWQGTAHVPGGHDLRFVLKIAKDEKGTLSATLYSIDQKEAPQAGDAVRFEGGTLRFVNQFPGLIYEGKMSADGNSINGTVQQTGSFPLVLERATPEKEWATPAAPSRIVPMATDAKPGVEVATVKPTQPGTQLFMLVMQGENLVVKNFALKYLLKFAYDMPERQIVGGPGWMDTDKWDIEAKPDTPGMPSIAQMRLMMQKVLADRFALKVHEEKREMPAYALTVGKNGPKVTKSADAMESANFTLYPWGMLGTRSATMGELAHLLQSNVLGQPVVDNTGLSGRWDFTLKWRPDETQFMGMNPPPPVADDANAPPPLFTAIQEQLGLKLEPRKVDAPVILVDHVERPSPN